MMNLRTLFNLIFMKETLAGENEQVRVYIGITTVQILI